jgi:hypothetical protein
MTQDNNFDDARRGLRKIAEAFKAFSQQHLNEDAAMRAVRSAAAGGRAAVVRAKQEFPKDWVEKTAEGVYQVLAGEAVSDGLSQTVRSFDEEKVKGMLDHFITRMKNDDTALKMARTIKYALDKAPDGKLDDVFDQLTMGRDPREQMMFRMVLGMLKPRIEEIRNSSEQEIAEKIKALADTIPTEAIALQVAALTREVTPERVQDKADEAVHKLPRPTAVADIAHGVGDAAIKSLGDASKARSLSDVRSIITDFKDSARNIVEQCVANDNATKPPHRARDRDTGGDFTF